MKTQFIKFNNPYLSPKHTVLSLGGFDGIHLGHQTLIKELLQEAKKSQTKSCLCIFDPLPFQVLQQKPFKRLFTIMESKYILKSLGIDFLSFIPFNKSFSKLSPKDFVYSFLVPHFKPVKIIIGYDFSFSHKQQGSFSTLKELGMKAGFTVHKIKACMDKQKTIISSSRIRKYLTLGDIKALQSLLGRKYFIQAKVTQGVNRGRKIGFPTANLQIIEKSLPALGVYGGKAKVTNKWYKAVINIGKRPTYPTHHSKISVEVHIISLPDMDLYGRTLQVQFCFFIRKEKAFPHTRNLITAIKQDINKVLSFS